MPSLVKKPLLVKNILLSRRTEQQLDANGTWLKLPRRNSLCRRPFVVWSMTSLLNWPLDPTILTSPWKNFASPWKSKTETSWVRKVDTPDMIESDLNTSSIMAGVSFLLLIVLGFFFP